MLVLSPAFGAGLFGLLFFGYFVRCLASPLRKLPGPWLSLFTPVLLRWHELRANRTMYIHALHQKYGPVVRIGPTEASFTSLEAVKEIYCSGGSGYDKTEFYDLFRAYGRRTMFTTLNKEDHARRRRILADRYANSNVMKPVSIAGIEERCRRFVKQCEEAGHKSLDIFMSLHSYACDCVTHHLFQPNGSNCLEDKADEEMMHQVAADDSLQNRLILHYSPLLHKLIARVLYLFAKPRETPLAAEYVLSSSQKTDAAPFTLISRLWEKSAELEAMDMAAECMDHMAAGIDTTGDGLCFLMWELSQPRSVQYQRRLQEELRQRPDAAWDKLPLLDAVVNESLRCFPPIPMSLPRYVPAGGRIIDGYLLPGHTTVSCQAYSVHHINEQVFPEPERFRPDRWLAREGDADRRRLMFAFASGGRGCIGKHLALAEMKLLLRDIYSRFSTVPDPAMNEGDMMMSDQLISSRPLGKRCLVRFEPIVEKAT